MLGRESGIKHFHNIESRKPGPQKTFGVFNHHIVSDKTGLLSGFPDVFPVPVARWKSPDRNEIAKCQALEIVAEFRGSGPDILVEPGAYGDGKTLYPRRVYILNHPEYDTDTLKDEYLRDYANNPDVPLPANYFPNNDPAQPPVNTWRHTGNIYTNWIRTSLRSRTLQHR